MGNQYSLFPIVVATTNIAVSPNCLNYLNLYEGSEGLLSVTPLLPRSSYPMPRMFSPGLSLVPKTLPLDTFLNIQQIFMESNIPNILSWDFPRLLDAK